MYTQTKTGHPVITLRGGSGILQYAVSVTLMQWIDRERQKHPVRRKHPQNMLINMRYKNMHKPLKYELKKLSSSS